MVEQNRDGQLRNLLIVEAEADRDRMASVRRYGGLPFSPGQVVEDVLAHLEGSGLVSVVNSAEDPEPSQEDEG